MLRIKKSCFGCNHLFSATWRHGDIVCATCTEKTFDLFKPLERIIAVEGEFENVTSCYSFFPYQDPVQSLILSTKIDCVEVCAMWLADTLLQSERVYEFFGKRSIQVVPQSLWSLVRGKDCFQEVFMHRIAQHVPSCQVRYVQPDTFGSGSLFVKRSMQVKKPFKPCFRYAPELDHIPLKLYVDDIATTGKTANRFCADAQLWSSNWLSICDAKRPKIKLTNY